MAEKRKKRGADKPALSDIRCEYANNFIRAKPSGISAFAMPSSLLRVVCQIGLDFYLHNFSSPCSYVLSITLLWEDDDDDGEGDEKPRRQCASTTQRSSRRASLSESVVSSPSHHKNISSRREAQIRFCRADDIPPSLCQFSEVFFFWWHPTEKKCIMEKRLR